LIVKRHQIDPLHGTAPLDAVAVNRFDHHSLATRFAKDLGNAIAVSHERPAGWSTANAGSGAFRRHRARRFLLDTPSLKQGLGLPDGHAQRLCAGNLSVRAYRCCESGGD
jgi:hypothetical protein